MEIVLPQSGVLPVVCPAAEPLAGARRPGAGFEVPGVLCRVVHEVFDLHEHGRTVGLACCQSAAACSPEPAPVAMSEQQRAALRTQVGFENCPIFQFDKDLIAEGHKSMGDEAEADAATDRAYRHDLTGSERGDVSFMGDVNDAAAETVDGIQQARERGGFWIGEQDA